jgi:hypothetical protein
LLTIAWFVPHFRKEKWTFVKVLAATVVVAAAVAMFTFSLQTRRKLEGFATGGGGIASVADPSLFNSDQKDFLSETARQQNALQVGFASNEATQEFNYQGLPARFEIPSGERHGYFGQEMLPTDREHAVRVVLVSSTVVWLIGMIFIALALATIWRARVTLAAGLRERLAPVPQVEVAV